MSDFRSYTREHRLLLRYGVGFGLIVATAVVTSLSGDLSGTVALKTVAAIPFAIAMITLPQIYSERALIAFSPSFIERGLLTAILLGCWIATVAWAPEQDWWGVGRLALIAGGTYFALHLAGGWFNRRRNP